MRNIHQSPGTVIPAFAVARPILIAVAAIPLIQLTKGRADPALTVGDGGTSVETEPKLPVGRGEP
ncbi:MAG TPA: hypothetical protein VNN08_06595 [Thermoanaerobaculia bacterium]|nr:hypothetical protein [Thermoanaerobaculia bacterium]